MDGSVVDNNSNFTNIMYLWIFEALLLSLSILH